MWVVSPGTPGAVSPGTACGLRALEHRKQRELVQQ
ncbi:hypothetical protein chiPu_0025408, partial [Chiloscyllium punctatum]|nr:hypothetical protein [Chiloscyllium punctatum]